MTALPVLLIIGFALYGAALAAAVYRENRARDKWKRGGGL